VPKINVGLFLFSSVRFEKYDDRAAVRALPYWMVLSFEVGWMIFWELVSGFLYFLYTREHISYVFFCF
jgi:hypothetical protein